MAGAGDGSGRLFVVEQGGRIRVARDGRLLEHLFLDLSERVSCCGKRGLLSVAFPPEYARRRHLYVNYTDVVGDTVVAHCRLTNDLDVVDAASGQTVLYVRQPFPNHTGGQLAFGPGDGYVCIGMGAGGSANDPGKRAQNRAELLGKLLPIDVEGAPPGEPYANPPDNPFVGDAAARPEIWALGLRNPWRFAFDRQDGDLYIADVGQNARKEIDFQPATSRGVENHGWRVYEGTRCTGKDPCRDAGFTSPIWEYDRGGCSVTGGFVYRGARFPALQGIDFYADYCSGKLWGLRWRDGGWQSALLLETGFRVWTFGEGDAGELHVARYDGGGNGAVLRLAVAGASAAHPALASDPVGRR